MTLRMRLSQKYMSCDLTGPYNTCIAFNRTRRKSDGIVLSDSSWCSSAHNDFEEMERKSSEGPSW